MSLNNTPIDYNKYPSNWKTEIRQAILQRAGQVIEDGKIVTQACCEMCGVKNKDIGYRTKRGKFLSWSEIENALENKGYDYFDMMLNALCVSKQNMTNQSGESKRYDSQQRVDLVSGILFDLFKLYEKSF